jgi:hypothetical protein
LLSLRSVSDDAAQLDAGAARLRLLTIQPLLVSSLLATFLFLFANVRGRCRGRARPLQCCIMTKLPTLRTAASPEVPDALQLRCRRRGCIAAWLCSLLRRSGAGAQAAAVSIADDGISGARPAAMARRRPPLA